MLLFQPETTRLGSYARNRLNFTPNGISQVIFTQDGVERPKKDAFKLEYNDTGVLDNYDEIYLL